MPRISHKELAKRGLHRFVDLHCNFIRFQCINSAIHSLIVESNSSDSDLNVNPNSTGCYDDLDSDSDSDTNPANFGLAADFMVGIANKLQNIEANRYLNPRVPIPKSFEWRENLLLNEPNDRFKACF